MTDALSIRPARPGDGTALHAMVRALAESHGYLDYFMASPENYEAALARDDALIGALIAFVGDRPAGCAIWHRSFSTFRGCETLYLEDLSVLPDFRRKGIAKALLKALARLAVERGAPSVSWLMMGWNDAARRLYAEAGAEIEDGNSFCRIHGEALERLAG